VGRLSTALRLDSVPEINVNYLHVWLLPETENEHTSTVCLEWTTPAIHGLYAVCTQWKQRSAK